MSRFERVVLPTGVEPACPAAARVSEAAGGTGCVCRVTDDLIQSARDPSTLNRFCFNDEGYQGCSTWKADRDEYLASRLIRPLLNSRGDRVGGHPEDRERNQGLDMALEAQEYDRWQKQQTT